MRLLLALVLLCLAPGAASAATLGGTVFGDTDADGRLDRGEPVLSGVAVEVQRQAGRRYTRVTSTRTGAKGTWSYTIRRTGRYRARITLPDRSVRTTAARRLTRRGRSARFDVGARVVPAPPCCKTAPTPVPVPPPAPAATPPAPLVPIDPGTAPLPATTVGDRVWNDLDRDGVQDAGEPGLAGVTVETWDATRTTQLRTTTSDAQGGWSLPVTGSVRVRVVLPDGAAYAPTDAAADDADSDIRAAGSDQGFTDVLTAAPTGVDIGLTFPGLVDVGNRVWRDTDEDGVQDAGETNTLGLGRQAELWNESRTQRLDQTTVVGDGGYTLQVPAGLSFRVRMSGSPSDLPTARDATNDAQDSDFAAESDTSYVSTPQTTTAGTLDVDLGLVPAFTLGNFVWRDSNGNGVQDSGEPGVPGVTVQAWNAARTTLLTSTRTDANGNYRLVLPVSGTFFIGAVLPPGFQFSPKDAAGNDQTDSDAEPDPASGNFGFAPLYDPPPNIISVTTFDFGLRVG